MPAQFHHSLTIPILPIFQITKLCVLIFIWYAFQPSFDKVVPSSLMELGLTDLVSIYSELCQMGKPPPIIDAADLQQDPEVVELSKHVFFFTEKSVDMAGH